MNLYFHHRSIWNHLVAVLRLVRIGVAAVTVAPVIQMIGPFRVSDSRSVDGDSDNHGHEPYAFRAYLIIYYIFLMDIITVLFPVPHSSFRKTAVSIGDVHSYFISTPY